MISKELLSEVLGVKVNEYHFGMLGNNVEYDELKSINIHELAHKVKEWALSQGYSTFSYNDYDGSGFYVQVGLENKPQPEKWSYGKTEPEAIFKAGDYILKELKNGKS